jgi:hypothetical protein
MAPQVVSVPSGTRRRTNSWPPLTVTPQAVQSSEKSRPNRSSAKVPLSASAAGSWQVTPRSHWQLPPQHRPSEVQVATAQGDTARQVSWPSHTVPGPHCWSPQATVGPASTQASAAGLQVPLMTSQTSVGPQGSGSWPWQVVSQAPSTHCWLGSLHAPQPPPVDDDDEVVSGSLVGVGPVLVDGSWEVGPVGTSAVVSAASVSEVVPGVWVGWTVVGAVAPSALPSSPPQPAAMHAMRGNQRLAIEHLRVREDTPSRRAGAGLVAAGGSA